MALFLDPAERGKLFYAAAKNLAPGEHLTIIVFGVNYGSFLTQRSCQVYKIINFREFYLL
jgi:hypothetical protein